MDRVLHGLKHRITRGYPVSNFIREVWNDELDSIRLAPELKPTLPKPLRKLLACYDERTLRQTIRQPSNAELNAAEALWTDVSPAVFALDSRHSWEEVESVEDAPWHRMQAFVLVEPEMAATQTADDFPQASTSASTNTCAADGILDHEVKIAECILALMSSNVRCYTTGIVVRGSTAAFWYADRMGIVVSQPFDVLLEPYSLWAAGVAIGKTPSAEMGVCPLITFASPEHPDFRRARLTLEDVRDANDAPLECVALKTTGHEVVPNTARGIVGRGTAVFAVYAAGKTKALFGEEPLVVKMTWAPQHQHAEDAIIRSVRRRLKGKKPQYLPCVTELLCSVDLSIEQLGLPRANMKIPLPSDERLFRLLVMPAYQPLTAIDDASEFATIFQDVVEAHRWVFDTAGIVHKDISIANIMFTHRGDQLFGVLTDWDLAGAPIPRKQPLRERHRLGSREFMSADFCAPWWTGEHAPRHDLESFYYVAAAFLAGFDPARHAVRLPADWLAEARARKADTRRNVARYHDMLFQRAAPGFRELADAWVVPLHALFEKVTTTTYTRLNSMWEIFSDALDKKDLELAQETADLIDKYMLDREEQITYDKFLRCIGVDSPRSSSSSSR